MSRKAVWLALFALFAVGQFAQSAVAQTLFWDASGERNGVLMEATYSEFYYADLVDQAIEVRIWNAAPNTRLKVFVRGVAIGVMRTNEFGFGKFVKGRVGVPLDGDDRPDAPRVEDGDLLQVGRMKTERYIEGEFMPR